MDVCVDLVVNTPKGQSKGTTPSRGECRFKGIFLHPAPLAILAGPWPAQSPKHPLSSPGLQLPWQMTAT